MLIFNSALAKSGPNKRNMAAQFKDLNANRRDPRHALPVEMFTNAGLRPADLYQEFDSETVRLFTMQEEHNILTDLLPGALSLPIGRSVLANARASDMGGFQSSMTGEIPVIFDGVTYDTDKTLIPIHQNGFKTNWREQAALSQEGFDDAAVKQEEALRVHRDGLVDYILNGTDDSYDGVVWGGLRNDARVDQVDLSAGTFEYDFTVAPTTDAEGAEYVQAFTALMQRRAIEQRMTGPANVYVSPAIFWAMQADQNVYKGSLMERLRRVPGVANIIQTPSLEGNEILSMIVNPRYIRLVVGMGISTIPVPRPMYKSPFAFEIVSAVGVQIRADGAGRTAVQMARG